MAKGTRKKHSAAFKILSHHMRDYRVVKPILFLEKLIIDLLKFNKMAIEEFPQGGFLAFSSCIFPPDCCIPYGSPFTGKGNIIGSGISHFSYIGRGIIVSRDTPFWNLQMMEFALSIEILYGDR